MTTLDRSTAESAASNAPSTLAPPSPPRKAHRPPRRAAIPLVLLLGALGWWGWQSYLGTLPPGPLVASGTVEADEVLVSSEVPGRLAEVSAREGQRLLSGDVVARLDDTLARLQLTQAVDPAVRQQQEIQLGRQTVRAPIAGVTTRVAARAGEVVAPGQVIAAIADLSQLKLTVYVPESRLGSVQVGQRLSVTADPFPGRSFEAVVTSINQRAEFTPRNVQTQRDRLNLAFGVRARVANPDGALKPGMPVDATFLTP
jgi:HlyD family secretion protein